MPFRRLDGRTAARLYAALAEDPDSPYVTRTLARAEERFARADGPETEHLQAEFVEPLLNLVSHPWSGVDPAALRARLGPATAREVAEVDVRWARVAAWVAEAGSPSELTQEAVGGIEDAELRLIAHAAYRSYGGQLVGLPDVVRYNQSLRRK